VKVARSKKTARSKGYAFIQFMYSEVAQIVAETMNGYMIMDKVLVSHVLNPSKKNPFTFGSSKQYKFINWKRIFMHEKNRSKSLEEVWKEVSGLLKNEKEKKKKLQKEGIDYEYPGF
jgi:nucleolar protein 15